MSTCYGCGFNKSCDVSVRDSQFAANDELAMMLVCYACSVEYMQVYRRLMDKVGMSIDDQIRYRECFETTRESIAYYESTLVPQVDTQIKTDDITLRFSHAAASVNAVQRVSRNVFHFSSTDRTVIDTAILFNGYQIVSTAENIFAAGVI